MAVSTQSAKQQVFSAEETSAILGELESILSSPAFSGSKRCHEFLEFIVRRSLAGDRENLTERFIGVELFGRAVDYETATDAIVRVRANDLRRRLAQYYSGPNTASAVTIGMASGSYVPEFHWHSQQERTGAGSVAPGALTVGSAVETAASRGKIGWTKARSMIRPVPAVIVLVLLAAVSTAAWLLRPSAPNRALDEFWQPVLDSKRAVTFCFGDTRSYYVTPELEKAFETDPQSPVKQGEVTEVRNDNASAGNVRAFFSMMTLLDDHGVTSQVRWPQEMQPAELESSNIIYIGAFNNSWTMSMNQNLRFIFERDNAPNGFVWMIRDRLQPGRQWSLSQTYPQPIDHDFAMITRILDPERKRVVISVGGLNQFGTQTAGEFLADGAALSSFARMAPKGWEKRNIQIVLEMGVSQNKAIDPKIVAFNVW
jgi:hypothetical protein